MGERYPRNTIPREWAKVKVTDPARTRRGISPEVYDWLSESDGEWDYSTSGDSDYYFHFEDPDTAFAFKIRWC